MTNKNVTHHQSTDKLHKSFADMIQKLKRKAMANRIDDNKVLKSDHEKIVIKVNAQEFSDLLEEVCKISVFTSKEGNLLYIEDPDEKIMRNDKLFMNEILSAFMKKETVTMLIDDIDVMSRKVTSILKNRRSLPRLNPLPSKYVVSKDNMIIDLEKREFVDFEELRRQYDIVGKTDIRLKDKHLFASLNPTRQFYREIISRVMQDWSKNQKDVEYLLWQMIFAVLQNDNHKKFFILVGPGGNGKSTFMKLLNLIAGDEQTQFVNIHQFGDHNSINSIDMRTRLVIGDDAATNHKISDVALSNMKSFVTRNPFTVNVKYETNRILLSNALFVQGTNTDINFFENNPALRGRAAVIQWTDTDYRLNKPADITFDLDDMMSRNEFISEWALMCIEKVEWFDKFSIPTVVENHTNEMIESNDSVKQFLEETLPLIDRLKRIPLKVLYDRYVKWSKLNNPSSGVMKSNSLVKELRHKQKEFGFKFIDKRKTFATHKYSSVLLSLFDFDTELLSLKQSYIEFDKDEFTQDEIHKFLNQHHPVANPTDDEIQLIKILKLVENNTFMQSLYANMF